MNKTNETKTQDEKNQPQLFKFGDAIPNTNTEFDTEFEYLQFNNNECSILFEEIDFDKEVTTRYFNKKDGTGQYMRVCLTLRKFNEKAKQIELVFAPSIYGGIKSCIDEYGFEKIRGCKVKRSGNGLETKYNVLPILV